MSITIKHELTDSNHFVEGRRLRIGTDVLENCHCGLWVLDEIEYDFCEEADIPVAIGDFAEQVNRFAKMTQAERTEARKYVADGLYDDQGVEFPCRVCGFQQEQEAIA